MILMPFAIGVKLGILTSMTKKCVVSPQNPPMKHVSPFYYQLSSPSLLFVDNTRNYVDQQLELEVAHKQNGLQSQLYSRYDPAHLL